jgi:hypothetical protein
LLENSCFVLDEVYANDAGVADHFQKAMSGWAEFQAFVTFMKKCKVSGIPANSIFNSLC